MKKKIFLISTSFLLVIIIVLFGFRLIIFNENLYKEEFLKHNVYNSFNSKDQVNNNLNLLINYLKNKDSKLETDFFNNKEKIHLRDVKNLIQNLILFLYLLIILLIFLFLYFIYKKKYKLILKSFISGSILTIVLILIFYLLILFNFDKTFAYFHLISFDNNYWLLNPETDNLIKMFPEEIFFDLTKIAIIYSLILSLIILIFLIFLYYIIFYRKFNIKKFFQ